MRLLNSETFEPRDFAENELPSYAILSHTWEGDEVTFKDLENGTMQSRQGYQKLRGFGQTAKSLGFQWIWQDTCCIDKSSSAELSEAINSMFRWYQEAAICIAYLCDIDSVNELNNSRWFKRGWTLQELIAPSRLFIYSKSWERLGKKTSLWQPLYEITNIPKDILLGKSKPRNCSIAQRMSWAAGRKTTRREDIAYCLLGLFEVNMPLLYGEGQRAFIRLQEEIIGKSDDQTLFAWHCPSERPTSGLLANSPDEFRDSASAIPFRHWGESIPYNVTNKGLRISMQLMPLPDCTDKLEWDAGLQCHWRGRYDGQIGIRLKQLAPGGDQFVRLSRDTLEHFSAANIQRATSKTIYVRQDVIEPPMWAGKGTPIYFTSLPSRLTIWDSRGTWSEEESVLIADTDDKLAALALLVEIPHVNSSHSKLECFLVMEWDVVEGGARSLEWGIFIRTGRHNGQSKDIVPWWPLIERDWHSGFRHHWYDVGEERLQAVVTWGFVAGQPMHIVTLSISPRTEDDLQLQISNDVHIDSPPPLSRKDRRKTRKESSATAKELMRFSALDWFKSSKEPQNGH